MVVSLAWIRNRPSIHRRWESLMEGLILSVTGAGVPRLLAGDLQGPARCPALNFSITVDDVACGAPEPVLVIFTGIMATSCAGARMGCREVRISASQQ